MATLQDHIESITLYALHGCEPGSCTRAILENDLLGACSNADGTTRYLLWEIVHYLVNHVSREIWGDPERVANHLKNMRTREGNEGQ